MYLFYSESISGNTHSLPPDESKHCIKVLRLKKGDSVNLTDGKGSLFESIIIDDNFKKTSLEITGRKDQYGQKTFNLHLAVAPTKNLHRYEWFLEKATEVGIDRITPFVCKHSERRTIQWDRLNKIITAAMKQSLKAYHPILDNVIDFQKFILQDFKHEKYIAYCNEKENNNNSIKEIYQKGEDALILIGPEGDFSGDEIDKALKAGFKPITLGPSRLRTETAALVACISINLLNI
jgi:16S rRNA (uracil1498-N3)-methyltransferase